MTERNDQKIENNLILEGKNAVTEALKNNKCIDKIMIKKGYETGSLKPIVSLAKKNRVVVQEVSREKLDIISQSKNHQGIIALCPAYEYSSVEEILQNAKDKAEIPFILILDGISDPRNFGAIIRTADACGVHGIIIPKHRSVGLTGIVSKTSAGAIAHVPIAKVTNISNTIDHLKKNGVWIACTNLENSAKEIFCSDFNLPIALVIGSEGFGVGKLIQKNCDFAVKIPMYGKISSLNASVAAGVIMYEVLRQRKFMN